MKKPPSRLVRGGGFCLIRPAKSSHQTRAVIPALALKLGSYLESGRLVASSYRIEGGSCKVRWRGYETLTGTPEFADSLVLPCDSAWLRLDGELLAPAPAPTAAPVARMPQASGRREARGEPPLVLEGCRFRESGALCRGRVRSREGGRFRLLRDGSRFAYDNGLRGPLGRWSLGGMREPVDLVPGIGTELEFEVGISLAHSGPREFHYFLLRYQVGEETWEWSGIPVLLPGR